ncbi:MAG: YqhA family protein [Alphaproteobacteria bacterium]|nr:YqhA family protein [Alphaproteobacteria bacterium]
MLEGSQRGGVAMEKWIEAGLLWARWFLLPLYVALLVSVVGIYVMVGREMWHFVMLLPSGGEAEMMLLLLSVLDLVLIANLMVMVAISSYESFVSRIVVENQDATPEWLGKLDSGNVKLKVSLSIVMISAIHLLRAYLMEATMERLVALGGIHLVFVLSTLGVALVDRMHKTEH